MDHEPPPPMPGGSMRAGAPSVGAAGSTPPPGATPTYHSDWYPDPTGRFEFRYHNGTSWTGDVSVDGKRFLDPLPTAPPSGYVTVPSGWSPATEPTPGSGKAVAAFVLSLSAVVFGWVPFLCVVALGAVVLAIVFAIGVLRRDRRQRNAGEPNPHGHGLATAALLLAPVAIVACAVGVWLTVVVFREVDEFTSVGLYTLDPGACGVDGGQAQFEGTITNLSSNTHTYRIDIEFVRPDTDNVLYRTTAEVVDAPSGSTQDWRASAMVNETELECRVGTVTGPLPFADD